MAAAWFMFSVCVVTCELFSINVTNTSDPPYDYYNSGIDLSNQHSFNGKESDFIWFDMLVSHVCHYCFDKWKAELVANASQYTSFLLFTRSSGDNYTILEPNNTQQFNVMATASFDPARDTVVIIHGWRVNATNSFAELIRKKYLEVEDLNVICVNWAAVSTMFYTFARSAVEPVGKFTAQFIDFLVSEVGMDPKRVRLIGHSLGAHIAGITGEYVTFGNITRITGLDPAGPMFGNSPAGRLDAMDADFVDVIHSCAGILGYKDPIGTVDFYPNGGTHQPGCGSDLTTCDHGRAYEFFNESITSLGFISTQCQSWKLYKMGLCAENTKVIMGEHVDLRAQGVYYLHTHSVSPYAEWNKSFTESEFEVENGV